MKKAAPVKPLRKQVAELDRKTPADDDEDDEPVRKVQKTTITPEQMAKFRLMLLAIRARLIGDVNMMSEEAFGSSEGGGDNHAPIHPAEIGSHSFEQEFTLNLLSSDGDRIDSIEAALEKIGSGSYGLCDECGGRIPKARLEVIPDTPYCVKCAEKLER